MAQEGERLHVGDRVKLTKKVAQMLQRKRKARKSIDWFKRRGVVAYVASGHLDTANVMWEGRMSVDPWPIGALVREESNENSHIVRPR
jgi:hypothetical protein